MKKNRPTPTQIRETVEYLSQGGIDLWIDKFTMLTQINELSLAQLQEQGLTVHLQIELVCGRFQDWHVDDFWVALSLMQDKQRERERQIKNKLLQREAITRGRS